MKLIELEEHRLVKGVKPSQKNMTLEISHGI
jgi:hypothetical protein